MDDDLEDLLSQLEAEDKQASNWVLSALYVLIPFAGIVACGMVAIVVLTW